MRLTLRTLLAYLDDGLSAADAREIGARVSESESTQDLIARIKSVVRKRRLLAPDADDPKAAPDACTVAEYLENHLDPELVVEHEKECLASDMLLAETASVHQILSMTLSRRPEIGDASRERIIRLVAGSLPIPARSRDDYAASPAAEAEIAASLEAAPHLAQPRLTLPATIAGVFALTAVIFVAAQFMNGPPQPRRPAGDALARRNHAAAADRPRDAAALEQRAPAVAQADAVEQNARTAAAEKTDLGKEESSKPAGTDKEVDKAAEPRDVAKRPATPPPPPTPSTSAREPAAPGMPPKPADAADRPAAKEAAADAARQVDSRRFRFLPVYNPGATPIFEGSSAGVRRLLKSATVGPDTVLMQPDGFRTRMDLQGGGAIELVDHTHLRIQRTPDGLLGPELVLGRIVFKPAVAGTALWKIGDAWQNFTVEGDNAVFGVERRRFDGEVDAEGRKVEPSAVMVVAKGTVKVGDAVLAANDAAEVTSTGVVTRMKPVGTGWIVDNSPKTEPNPAELFMRSMPSSEQVVEYLQLEVDDSRRDVRRLALSALACTGDMARLVDALRNPRHEDVRQGAIATIRLLLKADASFERPFNEAVAQKFEAPQAALVIPWTRGLPASELAKPNVLRGFVQGLESSDLAIRELALVSLQPPVGPISAFGYKSDVDVRRRETALNSWKKWLAARGIAP